MPTDIPLRLVADEDDPDLFLPYVTIEVDGMEVEALLDSGAARTRLADRPGLVVTDALSSHASTGAFGIGSSSSRESVVSCRVGGRDLGAVTATVVTDGPPGQTDLIGLDLLSRFRCLYRLADGVLTLDAEPPAATHPIHLGERRHIYFDLSWAGVRAPAHGVFDTGASVTVVDAGFAVRHPELFTPAGTSPGTDVSGITVETPMATMRGPRILGEQFADALVAIVDLSGPNSTLQRPMDLVLGWPITRQADWYVDHGALRGACILRP